MPSPFTKTDILEVISAYLKLTRPDNWFKNIFVFPGFAIAFAMTNEHLENLGLRLFIGLISACLIASANYVLNDWLDRDSDKFHPTKKMRPAITQNLNPSIICIEFAILAVSGLALANCLGLRFLLAAGSLLLIGVAYNVKPLRLKERVYLDVLSESINNPLRLFMGWFVVTDGSLPPLSLTIAYWMGGAFLMAVKRFSEFRFIADPKSAGAYRRSFYAYSEDRLLISILLCAMATALFGGIFLTKNRIELLITIPFYAVLFGWYLVIGLKPNSAAQHPEKLYKESAFIFFVAGVAALTMVCFFIDSPLLSWFLKNGHAHYP